MKKKNLSAGSDEPSEFGLAHLIGVILIAAFLWWGAWLSWTTVPGELWRDTFLALRSSAPVVRVDYMHFALLGSTVVPFIVTFFLGLTILAKWIRLSPKKVERSVKWMLRLGVVGLVLMIPVPMLTGAVVSQYVESQGYRPCSNLFEAGFMRYRRGFVLDPRLCVPPRHLKEALQRYEQKAL